MSRSFQLPPKAQVGAHPAGDDTASASASTSTHVTPLMRLIGSAAMPDPSLIRLAGPLVQAGIPTSVAAPATVDKRSSPNLTVSPRPSTSAGPEPSLALSAARGDGPKRRKIKLVYDLIAKASLSRIPLVKEKQQVVKPAASTDKGATKPSPKESSDDGQVPNPNKRRRTNPQPAQSVAEGEDRSNESSAVTATRPKDPATARGEKKAYESAPADAARLLAVSNQACAASADPSSSTGDNATVSLDSPEIAHDRFRQANSLQNALTDVELQERLNHLKGRRLWVAKRAKSHAELDESTAAARAGREKDGASAALEGTDEQKILPPETLPPPSKPAITLSAEATAESATTMLLSTHQIAVQPLDPKCVIKSCEQMNAIAARLTSSKKKKRPISTVEEQ